MSVDIDLSNFRESPNLMIRQPLFPFVEVTIGGITVSDFNDDKSDTVMSFSYKRTAKQDVENTADNTFTLTMYDDTAVEIEAILYSTLVKTAKKTQEELNKANVTTKEGDSNSNTTKKNNSVVESFFRKGIKESILGVPDSGSGKSAAVRGETDNEDNSDTDSNNSSSNQRLKISDKLNNINISYGWADRNGNIVSEKKVNANFTKYSIEFEGASTILSTEGVSLDNTLLSSPSESVIKEYPASKWKGVASDIVKDVINSTGGLTYKKGDIEATESILNENGKPKSFIRNGETASVFIKKYLCEEAKSKKSGKVGYDFTVDKGRVTFKPSNISNKGVSVSGETAVNRQFNERDDMDIVINENQIGAGLVKSLNEDIEGIRVTKDSKVAEYAQLFAYEYGTDSSLFSVGNGNPKEEYQKAFEEEFQDRTGWDTYDSIGASCTVFVATVIRSSGVDKNFPIKYLRQRAKLALSGKWVDIGYTGNEELKSGDIITYKKRKTEARFIGIYVEKDNNRYVACAMDSMSYGYMLGGDKVNEILDTSDKLIDIYREKKLMDYTDDIDYKEDVE